MCKESSLSGSPWDVVFNYLGQVDNVVTQSAFFKGSRESSGANTSGRNVFEDKLSIGGIIRGGELAMDWRYSKKHYKESTVRSIAERYMSELESLINHCLEQGLSGSVFTPWDYGL